MFKQSEILQKVLIVLPYPIRKLQNAQKNPKGRTAKKMLLFYAHPSHPHNTNAYPRDLVKNVRKVLKRIQNCIINKIGHNYIRKEKF